MKLNYLIASVLLVAVSAAPPGNEIQMQQLPLEGQQTRQVSTEQQAEHQQKHQVATEQQAEHEETPQVATEQKEPAPLFEETPTESSKGFMGRLKGTVDNFAKRQQEKKAQKEEAEQERQVKIKENEGKYRFVAGDEYKHRPLPSSPGAQCRVWEYREVPAADTKKAIEGGVYSIFDKFLYYGWKVHTYLPTGDYLLERCREYATASNVPAGEE